MRATLSPRDTQLLAQKLGQLQAQLLHLPTLNADDEYQWHLDSTRRFAGEVSHDLAQVFAAQESLPQGKEQEHA